MRPPSPGTGPGRIAASREGPRPDRVAEGPAPTSANPPLSMVGRDDRFLRRTLIVLAVGLLLLAAWRLVDMLLILFAAVVFAVLLRALADLVMRVLPVSRSAALTVTVFALVIGFGGGATLFGATITGQFVELVNQLPRAWQVVRERIGDVNWLTLMLGRLGQSLSSGDAIMGQVTGVLTTAFGIATNFFLIVFAGIYMAAQPDLYRRGLARLVPPDGRARFLEALDTCGLALNQWMIGQFIAMALVGAITGIGLVLLGVPSALALAMFAALVEFVPVVGPIIGAIPALIIALSQSYQLALWVLALFVIIQQIEGNLIQPLIQKRLVRLPPALLLFAIVGMGLLFGPMGILLAAPLTIVVFVLVRELYVQDILGDPVTKPGE